MNYFAHGFECLDDPYVLAGTAVPDWLSVADRKVRLRKQHVEPFVTHGDAIVSDVARGICRHLDDDTWFHRTIAFYEISGQMTREIRGVLGVDDGFRCGFLGHIVTELLLDAVLMERHPAHLDAYYAALRRVNAERLQDAVNQMARRSTSRLAAFIEIFRREEFLRDYLDDRGLLYRLNQVMRRVRLKRLPPEFLPALQSGRELLRQRFAELLR